MRQNVPFREGLFVESEEGGMLQANKCKSCGQIFFPRGALCFNCFSREMEDLNLSRKGKLYTYTVVRMSSYHFSAPYAVGWVELPEGIKVFAPIKGWEEQPLKVGMEMEMVIDKLWEEEEREVVGYKFKPVGE